MKKEKKERGKRKNRKREKRKGREEMHIQTSELLWSFLQEFRDALPDGIPSPKNPRIPARRESRTRRIPVFLQGFCLGFPGILAGIPRDSLGFPGIPWDSMGFPGIPWDSWNPGFL